MTRFARRSLAVAVAASAVSAATLVSAASAATISVGAPCLRYIPGLAGQEWVPVTGIGFTPNTDPSFNSVQLDWSSGDLAGFTPLAPDGSFATNALMPSDFIRSDSGWTKTYTLTATDRQTPGLIATTQATFVRAGGEVRPRRVRRNLRRKVRWSVYGPPTGSTIYAHWTFKGRRRATRKLGLAAGPCGITHKRAPFLPARPRNGTWRVYITVGRRFSRSRALFRMELNVFRTFSSRAAAARLR
jgi:hypothetical protein